MRWFPKIDILPYNNFACKKDLKSFKKTIITFDRNIGCRIIFRTKNLWGSTQNIDKWFIFYIFRKISYLNL